MHTLKRHTKKVFVGIVGGIVVLVGIVAIPYPGPGWLIVFSGLAILSTEFAWARRLLHRARGYYDDWLDWLKRQNIYVRLVLLAFTACVVIITVWLFNGYGLINSWLHLHWDWLRSPLLI
jgi:uncharacterized protein (TIGR02611 family)